MAAYAALVSLMHIIHDIENHHSPPISLDKQQLQSLTQNLTFFQEFLEGYISQVADSDEADSLEMRIADAAYAAEDVIESNIVAKIQHSGSSPPNHDDEQIKSTKLYRDLQQVVVDMDSIKKELMEKDTAEEDVVQDQRPRSVPAPVDSSSSKNSMVCPDHVLKEIVERVVAETPARVVIPIVGMGGIAEDVIESSIFEKIQPSRSKDSNSDEADPLEMQIADKAYAAEDVIESNIVKKIRQSRSKDSKQVVVGMDSKEELMKKGTAEKGVIQDERPRLVPARVDSSSSKRSMVCPDHVLKEILERVVEHTPDRVVIPIVGMGGIGKTTLARTIYSNKLIENHFDVLTWATISQQYNTRDILSELLSEATKKDKEKLRENSEDDLRSELHRHLYGRRFLIILDDMWSIDAWDRVQLFFPDNQNGSRVLVTTRLMELSSQLKTNYYHQMEFLDEVTSWNLFSRTVFGNDSCPRELEDIGKKIVENCRGLPLSIVVVGGLLKKMEQTQRCWESISKNSIVKLDNDKHCLRLLKTSYNHLPVHMKACFLYMGVFEEDAEIKVSTLVKLWECEGFLKPTEGKSLKTIATDLLKDLIDRNLVRIDQLGSTGNVKICKIHDLLRDLCLNEGKKDGFYHVVGQHSPRDISSQRRVVIPRNTSKRKVRRELQSMQRARSVISEYGKVPRCRNLRLLRILHAYKFRTIDDEGYNDESYVHSQMFLHVNSRHLAVEVRRMSSFFHSINLFWNIHTLIVSCTEKSTAPVEIWKMRQLRHISFVDRSLCLPDPPADEVIMENLHTVMGVENLKCGEEVIRRIPNIKKLKMRYDGGDITEQDDNYYYCRSNIERLCKLESLQISCAFYDGRAGNLLKITFPKTLKKLTLEMNPMFLWEFVMETLGSLPHLEKLKLWMGRFLLGVLSIGEGQFPSLKYLGVMSCNGLTHLSLRGEADSVLPRLEWLYLFYLVELEEIDRRIGEIPTLQKISVQWCSESAVKSAKVMVDEQVECQGDELPFQVWVSIPERNEELLSLAGPNFKVSG